jgi:ABC-type Zn uptake system ZnuABC Zn-binding protein ZnuA
MRRFGRLVLLAGLYAPACAAQRPLQVAVSIQPLEAIARQIGGERIEVHTLLPPGSSPHTFEPTPGDMARLAGARLFVRVGGGLEEWADTLLASESVPTLTLMEAEGLRPLATADEHGGAGEPAHEAHDGHDHGPLDPHFWTDPLRMRDAAVPALVRAFSEADPSGAALYAERGRQTQLELTRLDAELRQTLASVPSRAFISFHNSWSYFAARYDLDQVAVVEEFPDAEPTARRLARLVDEARGAGVRALLIEPQQSRRIATTIAAEFGAILVQVDPLGDPADPQRATYGALLRYNARAFVQALELGTVR